MEGFIIIIVLFIIGILIYKVSSAGTFSNENAQKYCRVCGRQGGYYESKGSDHNSYELGDFKIIGCSFCDEESNETYELVKELDNLYWKPNMKVSIYDTKEYIERQETLKNERDERMKNCPTGSNNYFTIKKQRWDF